MEKSNTREEILEAAQFSSLITIWINLCDREPERKEVMELVRKHVSSDRFTAPGIATGVPNVTALVSGSRVAFA